MIFSGVLSVAQSVVVLLSGFVFNDFFHNHAILQLDAQLSILGGALLSFFVASFLGYWWHRASHHFDFLWRVLHQLHHSPQRIESLTAFFTHPLDSFIAGALNAFAAYFLLGFGIETATLALIISAIYNLYIHSDTKSPVWLGYLIQRPEMHRVHHKRNIHKNNYGLPIWDLIFGTFENPKSNDFETGFSNDKTERFKDMLLGRDVHSK